MAPTQGQGGDITVLGLDPGSRVTGWGIIREVSGVARLVATGTIRCGDSRRSVCQRLGRIHAEIAALIAKHGPAEVAVENVFVSKNVKSAIMLGQARGAAISACGMAGVPVASYEPTKVKQAIVGVGRADKAQVAFMVARVLGEKGGWAEDASDALAVALCHLNTRRLNRLTGKATKSAGGGR